MKLLVVFVAALVVSGGAAFGQRAFKDNEGRTIKATITSVRPPNVVLKRSDGKSFTFPIGKLSKEEQAYVKGWKSVNIDYRFAFRFDKDKISSSGPSTGRRETWQYNVTVDNCGGGFARGAEGRIYDFQKHV